MNVTGPAFSFNPRVFEPKPTVAKPEPETLPAQQRMESSAPSSSTSAVGVTGSKGHFAAGQKESVGSAETSETETDESVTESSEESEESVDLTSDNEMPTERAESEDDLDEPVDERNSRRRRRFDQMEAHYGARFIVINQLLDQLSVTHDSLTQQLKALSNSSKAFYYP